MGYNTRLYQRRGNFPEGVDVTSRLTELDVEGMVANSRTNVRNIVVYNRDSGSSFSEEQM